MLIGFAFFALSNRQEDAENPMPMINSDIAADTGTVRCVALSVSEKREKKKEQEGGIATF